MGIGCSQMGSGALWLHPIAPGRDVGSSPLWSIRAGPSRTSTYLSIPEVPTPSGLLSPMRGMDVCSLALVEIPIHLGMAWVALVARRHMGAYLFSSITSFSLDTLVVPYQFPRYLPVYLLVLLGIPRTISIVPWIPLQSLFRSHR